MRAQASFADVLSMRLLTGQVRDLLARQMPDTPLDGLEWRSWPQTFATTTGPWPRSGGVAMTTCQVTVGYAGSAAIVFDETSLFAFGHATAQEFWTQVQSCHLAHAELATFGLRVLDAPLPAPPRPGWDEWALGLAAAAAARADCTRRKVGAVLLDPAHRVVGTGYNGYPSGAPGCLTAGACPRGRLGYTQVAAGSDYLSGDGTCLAIHAEENCVLHVDAAERAGATLYVTDEPCPNCQRFLAGSGIATVVWPGGRIDYDTTRRTR